MSPNPIQSFWNRKGDWLAREGGWGPLQSWPVPRGDEPPLILQLRLPLAMDLVDIGSTADNAPVTPASAAQGAAQVASAARTGGLIFAGSLREKPETGAPVILASMSITFSDVLGPPNVDDHLIGDVADDVRPLEIERLSDWATQISRLRRTPPPEGDEALPLLTTQFLIESTYGLVAYAYATSRPEMIFGGSGRDLFRTITATGYIGERPQSF
jgi:hypothetical protein